MITLALSPPGGVPWDLEDAHLDAHGDRLYLRRKLMTRLPPPSRASGER